MSPDYKALCAELVTDINEWMVGTDHRPISSVELVDRARAALAQRHVSQPYKLPEPVAPTDEELDELWAEIDGGGAIWAWQYFARAVLARWGTPAINTSEEILEAPNE